MSPIVPTNGKDQELWGELCCHTPAHVCPGHWAGWPPMACRAAGSLQPFTSGFCGYYPAGSWSPERLALCFPGQGTASCPFPQGMCGKTRDPCASRCCLLKQRLRWGRHRSRRSRSASCVLVTLRDSVHTPPRPRPAALRGEPALSLDLCMRKANLGEITELPPGQPARDWPSRD